MEQINKGLDENIDVSIYADPEDYDTCMKQIRLGLENGINISVYTDPKFN